MRSRVRTRVVGVLIAATLGCAAYAAVFDNVRGILLLRSEVAIQEGLLRKIPVGVSKQDVERFMSAQGAGVFSRSDVAGVLDERGNPVGSQHVRYRLGRYSMLYFTTSVTCTTAFDAAGKLVYVKVRKETDA